MGRSDARKAIPLSLFDEAALRALIAEEMRRVLREEVSRLVDRDEYLSVASAAQLAELTPDTIRAWIREGRLSERWAGRERRVRLSDLERALATPPTARTIGELSPEEEARQFLARQDASRGGGQERRPRAQPRTAKSSKAAGERSGRE